MFPTSLLIVLIAALCFFLIIPANGLAGYPSVSSKKLSKTQINTVQQILKNNSNAFSKDWVNGRIGYYVSTQGKYMKQLYSNFTKIRQQLRTKLKAARQRVFAAYSPQQLVLATQLQGLEDNQMLRITGSCGRMNDLIAAAMRNVRNDSVETAGGPGTITSLKLKPLNCSMAKELPRVQSMYFPVPNGRMTGYDRFPWNKLN